MLSTLPEKGLLGNQLHWVARQAIVFNLLVYQLESFHYLFTLEYKTIRQKMKNWFQMVRHFFNEQSFKKAKCMLCTRAKLALAVLLFLCLNLLLLPGFFPLGKVSNFTCNKNACSVIIHTSRNSHTLPIIQWSTSFKGLKIRMR